MMMMVMMLIVAELHIGNSLECTFDRSYLFLSKISKQSLTWHRCSAGSTYAVGMRGLRHMRVFESRPGSRVG